MQYEQLHKQLRGVRDRMQLTVDCMAAVMLHARIVRSLLAVRTRFWSAAATDMYLLKLLQ